MEKSKDQPNSKIRWPPEIWWLSSSLNFTIVLKGIWTSNCQTIMYMLRKILYRKRYYGWFSKIAFNKHSFLENSWPYFTCNVKRRTYFIGLQWLFKSFRDSSTHAIIQKLHKIGFSTLALKWFISYLENRLQYVQVNDSKPSAKRCHFGVQQWSVLGPLLFNLYVSDLQDIDPADLVNTCQYADDTTQYEHFKISQIRQTIQNTQKRLDNLNVWSRKNNLLLNGAKTKYIIFLLLKSNTTSYKVLNIHLILTTIKCKRSAIGKFLVWSLRKTFLGKNILIN